MGRSNCKLPCIFVLVIANILFLSLDDILRDCAEHMHEVMRKNEDKYAQIENPVATADVLGISSVMVQDMTGKRYETDPHFCLYGWCDES